ncbi:MAG: hypothetical protein KAU31_17560, partial [Spirochaetaceae bacterium]|nr:hypothetical protein [Spirochaetaceae bacterium]
MQELVATVSQAPRIIVLDDDPTGSQTVHSCLLFTRWDKHTLRLGLTDKSPIFFILTNTRGMSPDRASAVTSDVCRNLRAVLREHDTSWLLVSRSDSTLRGHYPIETDVISKELGPFDAHFLVPAFFEGGRVTRGGMHYVVEDGVAVPAHETPFARDTVFGYTSSFLPEYVEEKTGGRIRASEVVLFEAGMRDEKMHEKLQALSGNVCCAVSAETQDELDCFARVALDATAQGKRFLFRSAASLLTSLAGLPPQPVAAAEMIRYVKDGRPGLILVGSYVPLTTRQLDHLLGTRSLDHIEIDVNQIPNSTSRVERSTIAGLAESHASGRTVVVSTSRTERRFSSRHERLAFGSEVSALLMR